MSNDAGRILLAILHGKPFPSQRRRRNPYAFPGYYQEPPIERFPNLHQQPYFQATHNDPHPRNSVPTFVGHGRPSGFDINFNRPARRYTREVMLSYADSEASRRVPRRLELAFESLPTIRRKRFGDLANPYYYDPATTCFLGPTQLWDSELQQWVVMGQK